MNKVRQEVKRDLREITILSTIAIIVFTFPFCSGMCKNVRKKTQFDESKRICLKLSNNHDEYIQCMKKRGYKIEAGSQKIKKTFP